MAIYPSPPHDTAQAAPVDHLAIIMDGNGRWAKQRGLSRSQGHKAGTEAAKRIVEECVATGIRHLTLYTFSKENWSRPKDEIRFLFDLLVNFIKQELSNLERRGVRLHILGETAALPLTTRTALAHAIKRTCMCSTLTLNLALNYSGREEIVRACRQCVKLGLAPEAITSEQISNFLYTAGQPDPDLIIRTSGELRTSNFLLFQSAYSEFYFTDTYWPDFSPAELHKILEAFQGRKRRFGGISSTTP